MTSLIQDKLRNNNSTFFREFSIARKRLEQFLIDNKSVLGVILQNLSKGQRVPRMRDLFDFLVTTLRDQGKQVKVEDAIGHLGLRGRILDVNVIQTGPRISDDTKSSVYVQEAIKNALRCPVCGGILDPKKSVSYDHIIPKRDHGTGDITNTQMAHPYCNSNKDTIQTVILARCPKR